MEMTSSIHELSSPKLFIELHLRSSSGTAFYYWPSSVEQVLLCPNFQFMSESEVEYPGEPAQNDHNSDVCPAESARKCSNSDNVPTKFLQNGPKSDTEESMTSRGVDLRSQPLCAVWLNGSPSVAVVRYLLPPTLYVQHRVGAIDCVLPVSGSTWSCAATLCRSSLLILY